MSNFVFYNSVNSNSYAGIQLPASGTAYLHNGMDVEQERLLGLDTTHCPIGDEELLNPTTYFQQPRPARPLINSQIQLRFLNPGDYDSVKTLCEEWFPVHYPAKWFEAITSDTDLFRLAAILDGRIIGLIVSELKHGRALPPEDKELLCQSQLKYSVAYILSLGVVDSHRRQGIASLLLSSLLNHLQTLQCKAVYLHVLTSNEPALHFYEKHRFRVHRFLPYYYSIGGKAKDGFTYVLYFNGGHGPWGLQEYLSHFCELIIRETCSLPSWCVSQVRRVAQSVLSLMR